MVPYLGKGSDCDFAFDFIPGEKEFCAGYPEGGKGVCDGDSGGPVVKRIQRNGTTVDVLVGVISWGVADCAAPNSPSVHASVSLNIDWIKSAMCNDLQSAAPFCNNPVPSEVAGCPNEDEEELLIQVTTDAHGMQTKWLLLDSTFQEIKKRSYHFNNYTNVHKICVKSDEEYTFKIIDRAKNGMCSGQCGSYSLSVRGVELVSGDGVFTKTKYEPFFVVASSDQPSLQPSFEPSVLPSLEPSLSTAPSLAPSLLPSLAPSVLPSLQPSFEPSGLPSLVPSSEPSLGPSLSALPSFAPSALPSVQPSISCKDKKNFKTGKSKSCRKHIKGQNASERCAQKHNGDFVYEWCPESCGKAGIGVCGWLMETESETLPMSEIQV